MPGPEGSLMELLTKAGQLILLTLLWLICCIPIVTIVPSTTSFYYGVVKVVRRGRGYVAEEFFRSVKRTLGKGILLTVGMLLWFSALLYGRQTAVLNGVDGFDLLLFTYDLLLALSGCVCVCLFPVYSRFEMKLTAIIKLSFVMAVRYIYYSIPLLAGTIVVGWLAVMKLPMLSILILPGFWCYGASFLVERMLLGYMPPAKDGEDAWYREEDSRKHRENKLTGKGSK